MVDIRIWAPTALKVDIETAESRTELTADGQGYWEGSLPAGTRYYVHVDDGMRLPDPRSMRQPEGAHGPSEAVDPASFTFTYPDYDAGKLDGAVYYELHIGTFTREGTFRSAIDKLDHLKDLGVDAIEIMPIAPIPGNRNWGYDGVQIFALNEAYGAPEDLVALIDAIHERGMAAVLDVVYNHFGPDGNYLAQFGPYFTAKHTTPWGEAVNLDDAGSPEVRRYIIDNAKQWLRDYRFDGLRLDATDFLKDDSEKHILAEISDDVATLGSELGRTFSISVESDFNDPITITPTSDGGRGGDMQWVDDIHHSLHVWLTGETNGYYRDYTPGEALETVLTKGYFRAGQYNSFRGSEWGHPLPDSVSGHRLVAYDENHDQVGNRLLSDRPSEKLNLDQLAVSRTIILLSPFTPMLFMGEEWATTKRFSFFTDYGPEIGSTIKAGRLEEFKDWDLTSVYGDTNPQMPDPQDISTFEDAKLDWEKASEPDNARFLSYVRDLIALRKSDPDVASGDRSQTQAHIGADSGWIRRGSTLIVFTINTSGAVVEAPIEHREPVLGWDEYTSTSSSATFTGAGVAILR